MTSEYTTDDVPADEENPPVYHPNAPLESDLHNAHRNSNIAYDASGNAQYATIDQNDNDAAPAHNSNSNSNSNSDNNDNNDNKNNGESFKNNSNENKNNNNNSRVYNGNNDIGEGANVNDNNNNDNKAASRLPPWFESTGNASVDYKLARSRFCCCSLRAGIETLGLSVILISIWDLLISSQFAEEETLVNFLSLYRILGGICGFFGAWKYHKNASLIFIIFWIIDAIITFILLIWSISLINNCDNSYDENDQDWGWWYDDCKYKYENLTGLYIFVFAAEIYFVIVSRRFYRLMKEL